MNLVRLGDVASVKSGFAFKSKDWQEVGVPVIKIGNVKDGWITLDGCSFVDEAVAKSAAAFELIPGDILISMTGHIGQVAKVRNEGRLLLNQRVGRFSLRRPDQLDREFLFQWLRLPEVRAVFEGHAYGAAQPNISPTLIEQQSIPLPPPATQRRIASILSAYDDLIENNTRRIAILEELARRIYEEWFVRFRFPGHENVRMAESELGLVPEEWLLRAVSDVAVVHRGRSYKGAELADEGGRPFINLKCIDRDGGYRSSGLKRYTGPFKDSHTVRAGEMVMAVTDMTQERRIVARVGRVGRLEADFGVVSMDLVRIASRGDLHEPYLYAMFRWSGFADEVKQHANGANVLHLLPARIEEHKFVCPPKEVANGFAAMLSPMLTLCDTLEQKNANLRITRDLLLPKLISGELDVSTLPDPEAAVA